MIKSDLRKMKYERQEAGHTDSSELPPPTANLHPHHKLQGNKAPHKSLHHQPSFPTPKKTHAKEVSYR